MAQNFTDNCFDPNNVAQTDLQNIENNCAALKSQFSGAGAPATPVAGMPWVDLTRHMLCVRNEANNAWLDVFNLATGQAVGGFPSGTLMLFIQTAAPTGWTKSTAHNNKALRVVSGTAGSGGSVDFSTVFAKTATDGHTLTTAQMPSHTHTYTRPVNPDSEGSSGVVTGGYSVSSTIAFTTDSSGSSNAHSHNMDIRVKYVDAIIASKD